MPKSGATPVGAQGITQDVKPNTLVDETLAFVRRELAGWRDDPERKAESAEEKLNLQLCKYLNVRARHDFPMAYFNHEEPQGAYRRIDLSVTPENVIVAGARSHTKYEPYLVMEGKRLPAPSRAREQEYVTGGQKITGGLQRFKLGLHGGDLEIGAMIAYVQDGDLFGWVDIINGWIKAIHDTDCTEGFKWSHEESLDGFQGNADLTSSCRSTVSRTAAATPKILIHHLWVAMRTKPAASKRTVAKPRDSSEESRE